VFLIEEFRVPNREIDPPNSCILKTHTLKYQ
jgi:hypothetical protein